MFYESLGNDQFRVTFKVYRDCDVSLNPYENPAEVNVFDLTNGNLTNTPEFFDLVGTEDLNLIGATACDSAPANACYRLLTYEKILTLPQTQGGYFISYTRCCRTGSITNLANGLSEGMTVGTTIPGTLTGIGQNSSPIIGPEPEIFLCVDQPIDFDLGGIDPDGDSLVYELINPLSGTYDLNLPPPYPLVNFESGYSALEPLGAGSQTFLDPITGVLSMTPSQQGMFQFGLQVSEYRNGILIGTTIRDFFFIVRVCASLDYEAGIRPQENLNDFVSYCQGLTINFINTSDWGDYLWDFGVDGSNMDTSSLVNPSFTFPQSGNYEVSVILNPGLQCSDTATSLFRVYEIPDLEIASDSVQCFDNNNFDFEVIGNPNDSAQFSWDLGSSASPSIGLGQSISGIVYNSIGVQPVIMYYDDNYCSDTIMDSIRILNAAQINLAFTKPDEIACAPYALTFTNLSSSSGNIQYYWEFGDGQVSTDIDPTTVYAAAGVYDVTLYGIVDDGCTDTSSITYPSYVEVYSSPIAGIDADRYLASPYDPVIEFYNQSINYSSFEFHVEDQTSSISPFAHTFVNSGIHYPYIVAYNDEGCSDTASVRIEITAEETIFIPNAFTPNGDGKNDQMELNLFDLDQFVFRIFNPSGVVIYETTDPQGVWDASYRGQIVPDGVYVYQLEYLDLKKIPEVLRGTITVLR